MKLLDFIKSKQTNSFDDNVYKELVEETESISDERRTVYEWMSWAHDVGVTRGEKSYSSGRIKSIVLIEDINSILEDVFLFPEQHGGRFDIRFSEKENELSLTLSFKQGDKIHNIIVTKTTFPPEANIEDEKDAIYKKYYSMIFRRLFLSVDQKGNESFPDVISFQTLIFKGLQ